MLETPNDFDDFVFLRFDVCLRSKRLCFSVLPGALCGEGFGAASNPKNIAILNDVGTNEPYFQNRYILRVRRRSKPPRAARA